MPRPRTSGSPTRPCFFPNGRITWGRDRAPGVVYSSGLVFRDVDIDVARPTSLVRCESPVEAALGDVRQVHGICSAICHADGAWVDHRAKWIYKGQRLLSNFPLWRSEDRLGRPTGYLGCACGAHMGDCSARYRSSQAKSPWTSATELILESSGLVAPESIMMLTEPVPSLPFAVRRASYSDCTG